MTADFTTTARSKARRKPGRAAYDEAQVFAILDAGVLCHVGYVLEGQPFVTPTTYWREGRKLYWHGSAASRMIKAQASGLPVCLTVSHVDGLVVARSGISHSMNYRSVMVFGRAREVEGLEAKRQAMSAFIDRLYPRRSAELPPVHDNEIKQIGLVEMDIEEASAKRRTGGSNHGADRAQSALWSGVIPITTVIGRRMADADMSAGLQPTASLAPYVEGARFDDLLTALAR
jgi:nitroimidazol reductase NimA-like FMN-containing flavoprotein (pyridoxamine 5'-phosphate oxidase superfamily)